MNKKNDLLKTISNDLQLNFEQQDWGIINASPERIHEFMEYYNNNVNLPNTIKYQLLELIIASFNEALVKNMVNENQKIAFKEFIKKNASNSHFRPILNYWKKIANISEFPVGHLLKQIKIRYVGNL